jgi:hypothetical protein
MSIAAKLVKYAAEELSHALIILAQVDYLGGIPVTVPKPVITSVNAEDMLRLDITRPSSGSGERPGRGSAKRHAISDAARRTFPHQRGNHARIVGRGGRVGYNVPVTELNTASDLAIQNKDQLLEYTLEVTPYFRGWSMERSDHHRRHSTPICIDLPA